MKKNYILLSAYMIIMGVGLFVCNQFLNTPYNSTEFSRKFLPFMILLAVLVLYHGIKNKKELTLYSERKPGYVFSALLFIPVVGFGLYSIVRGFSPDLVFLILIIDTALIGIAEEGMYRGILLGAMAKKMNPLIAILLSSILFCTLHLLNVIGGLSVSELIGQLGSTFVMGVFLGAMYLDTRNILFPIIFHSSWDYILLSDSLADVEFLPVVLIGVYILEVFISLVIIIKLLRNSKQFE
ncbi:TPA: CPBP family intramembrane metalloprotease [Streptococcus suis]|uniref:CPBP family intramembrane glutamic endopeptidase n=1 Tax=Streptococcus dysgalactiae TaxID=1334 RepID=UPI0010CAB939|nr:CPBP family intramembrane glutamic endopeptidase [Streptococcus dysgalactiae]MCK3952081.1 CPBP family intramembrane metalloprotease [Streptococcus suis]MCK4056234.1 CPBP family intramembrane metalloprotease [Streptococcus suis]VTT02146.1 CAAX amino terminal protease [Streptococcus dysgalactiae]HEL2560696.1 CPBP family intramembrane metalloprotease [Streptococcus suis]HEL2613490.1 CPBP family intramembrane metalloprotease [Streptococcus suis]